MFIGHFAAALAAKRVAPSTSLGVLFAAAQWLDLLWPVLLLTGIEHAEVDHGAGAVIALKFTDYPYSHSLLAVLVWAGLLGALFGWRSRSKRMALVVAGLVASHWLLDLVVHVPDLPLGLGEGPRLGLGLWTWPLAALGLELALFAVAVVLYLRTRSASGHSAGWKVYSLLGFLVVIQLANAFGPPPPGMTAVAWSGLATWLLVAWAWWSERPARARAAHNAAAPGRLSS